MAILIIPLIVVVMFIFYYVSAKLYEPRKKADDPIASARRREEHRDWERYNKLVSKKLAGKLSSEELKELNRLTLKRSGQVNNTLADQREEWLVEEERKEKEWFDNTQL